MSGPAFSLRGGQGRLKMTCMKIQTQYLWVNADGGRLYVKRWDVPSGGGLPPILLFHDSLGCVELWREFPQQLALATGRCVVAYDRLGFGRSDPHPAKLANSFIRDEELAVRDLREQLGIGRFIAFGHSVGGGMAVATAGKYVADCVALITEAAQTCVEDRTIHGIVEAQRGFAQAEQFERLKKYHGDKAAWVLSAWVDTWLSPEFAGWSLGDDLRRVQCPVLAIHGDRDEFGSTLHPRYIAETVAGPSQMRILAGCGHVPHREMADLVLQEVARWLGSAVKTRTPPVPV